MPDQNKTKGNRVPVSGEYLTAFSTNIGYQASDTGLGYGQELSIRCGHYQKNQFSKRHSRA
ncbi:hypothetical protein B4923_11090 [Brenneria roseae subsp. americana]|uniref:Uncharacterized protein n=1 Tax=Brenneria roseae subsp. americana TaxID=1508507 RepID=A0A2U1TSP1_9GAMM|nr:hypothetical protein B4923_11090 [Brenneria roseae subsp. americana]